MKKVFHSICAFLLSLTLMAGTVASAFSAVFADTLAENAEDKEQCATFVADFSGLTDGVVSDEATIAALEEKFMFFYMQDGCYFERPKVNGYVCLDDGTSTYGKVENQPGTMYKMPDTGLDAGHTNWDGANNDWNYPLYTVEGEWLYLNAHPCDYAYRHTGLIYPKSTESVTGAASMKNFTLDMDFKFREYDENHVQFNNSDCDSLGIFARQRYLQGIDGTQECFNINFNGTANISNTVNGTPVQLKDSSGANTVFTRGEKYHLYLKAVNDTMEYQITDSTGKNVAKGSFDTDAIPGDHYLENGGYLGIGGSNEGVAMANIEIARLDPDGNIIDFNDENDGWGVKLQAAKLVNYRYVSGSKDGTNERFYIKNDEGSRWLYTDSGQIGQYYPGVESSESEQSIADAIHNKFNVYYDYHWHPNTFTKVDNIFKNTRAYEPDTGVPGIRTSILWGHQLFFVYDWRCRAEWNESNMMSLVPTNSAGENVMLSDFETEFTPANSWSSDPADGVAFSFRSGEAGKSSGYSDKVTMVIGQAGFQIYDHEMPAKKTFEDGKYIPWADNQLHSNPHINLKVVGNTLTIKATSPEKVMVNGSWTTKVLYEGTFDLKDGADTGYVYFTGANYSCGFADMAIRRLNSDGTPAPWENATDRTIIQLASPEQEITIDRKAGDSFTLPTHLIGFDAKGNKYNLNVAWSCNESYRSYKEGEFLFEGTLSSNSVEIAEGLKATIKLKNSINGDFDPEYSRKYYFDHDNDLLDFVCRHSTYDLSDATPGYKAYPVAMKKVKTSDYWRVSGGMATANYQKTVDGGWNGLTRASDITSMLLEDKDMMLLNYQLDIDYYQTSNYYSYVITNVQEPEKTFGDLWLNIDNAVLSNGANTDFKMHTRGGIYNYMENEGCFNLYGALEESVVRFERDLPGYTFIQNYMKNPNKLHHMTIRVVDGQYSVKVDDSAEYFANISDDALGGYLGFGGQGRNCRFDNLQITALNSFGEPVKLSEAEKGFAPEIPPDTYKGWQPTANEADFKWDSNYIQ